MSADLLIMIISTFKLVRDCCRTDCMVGDLYENILNAKTIIPSISRVIILWISRNNDGVPTRSEVWWYYYR